MNERAVLTAGEARARIVSGLARALVTAYTRQQEQKDERPAPLIQATGRDVRGKGGREHRECKPVD